MTLEPDELTKPSGPTDAQDAVALASKPGPSREYRAAVTFTLGGLFILVAVFLLANVVSTTPPVRGVIAFFGVLLGMGALLASALGLANGQRWAVAVATPMLVILVVAGSIEVLVALTHSSIDVPFGALLALWALNVPLRTPPDTPTGGRRWGPLGLLVVAAMLTSATWPIASPVLLASGGPFVVDEGALLPQLSIACNGDPSAPPTSIDVSFDWAWARTEPWPSGSDTITLVAYTSPTEGLEGYALGTAQSPGPGISQSNIYLGNPIGIVFSVDLGQAGFRPGSIDVQFLRASDQPSVPGSVTIEATYLHGPADAEGSPSLAVWSFEQQLQCTW